MSRTRPSPSTLFAALGCASLVGCAYGDYERDVDRTPVVNTGAGATIIYPGQTAPPAPGSVMPGAEPAGGATGTGTGSADPETTGSHRSGSAPGGGNVTFIGGSAIDEKRSLRVHEEPSYYKYLGLPFAILAAPFVAIAEAVRGEPEEGPEIPQTHAAPQTGPTAPAPPDYETQQLEAMERELAQRGAAAAGGPPAVSAAPGGNGVTAPPLAGAPATWQPQSIADELAALQRRPDFTAPSEMRGPAPAPQHGQQVVSGRPPAPDVTTPSPPRGGERPFATADGIVDRDGDGRIDQWIFREEGEIVRAVFDDDGDGHAERTLHYDRQTHRVSRVVEDTDRDGSPDSWSDFRDGELFRRRDDSDSDGSVDSWSYYRGEQLTRHEIDTTGDGFRDRTSFYEAGALMREEQDRDGDGRTDLTVHFDEDARIATREEDTDGDGRIDTISHYDGGRLTRRELLDPQPPPTAGDGPRE